MDGALESLTIPSTLKVIEPTAFERCKSVKRIKFLEGREVLGRDEEDAGVWNKVFRDGKVEEIALPSTLREMSSEIFRDCGSLKIVRVARGCPIDVGKFVDRKVEVLEE